MRLLEGPSGPPSRPLPPASSAPFIPKPLVLSMVVQPSASSCWGSHVRKAILRWGTHEEARHTAAFHSVYRNTEKLEKVARCSQAKSWQEAGRQDGAVSATRGSLDLVLSQVCGSLNMPCLCT